MPRNANSPPPSVILPNSIEPAQKRRRVTRACDECRKKKVKCDGQQPCIHCTVYSYQCAYDQPSNRKKSSDSDMGVKGKFYEDVLKLMIPNHFVEEDANDDNDQLKYNFAKFKELFTKLNNNGTVNLVELSRLYNSSDSPEFFSPSVEMHTTDSSVETPIGREIKIILPPKNVALKLVYQTWTSACVLFRFYHRPSFIRDLDNLYETDPSQYTNYQQSFLPLVYSVMACGSLFSKNTDDANTPSTSRINTDVNNHLDDEGYKYFIAARKLIDITDVQDIYGIQTIVMLLIFLQCSARLSTCYSYIGLALRAALKEGLHRKLSTNKYNPIELETRKRLFFTIYKLDIYVNAMLGLPKSISEEDFDQELPIELDDENITESGYLIQNQVKLSSSEVANQHTKLIILLSKIVKVLYPVNSKSGLADLSAIHAKVSELEIELKTWLSNLPVELKPGSNPPLNYLVANNYLHLAFLHVQIVLYRPFIHFISPSYQKSSQRELDPISFQRAKNCINVARTVIKLAQSMIDNKILSGAYWFSMYTIFFSVACLVFYVHSISFQLNYYDPNFKLEDIRKDAEIGKKVLNSLKNTSKASLRSYNILNNLFEQLNIRTAKLHPKLFEKRVPVGLADSESDSINNNFINTLNHTVPFSSQPIDYQIHPQKQLSSQLSTQKPFIPTMINSLDSKILGEFIPPPMSGLTSDTKGKSAEMNKNETGSFDDINIDNLDDVSDFLDSLLGINNVGNDIQSS